MKIAVRVIVEMSPEQVAAYCEANGIHRRQIRDDVSAYVLWQVQESPSLASPNATVGLYE